MAGFASGPSLRKAEPITRANVSSRVVEATLDALHGYDWHLYPTVRFGGLKALRFEPDGSIRDGEVLINASLQTYSGIRAHFTLPVLIRNGQVLEPSVLINDRGQVRILAQSSIDAVQDRGVFWQKIDPRGHLFSPPLPAYLQQAWSTHQNLRFPRFAPGPYRTAGKEPAYYAGGDNAEPVQPAADLECWTTSAETGKLERVRLEYREGDFDGRPIWYWEWLSGPEAGQKDHGYGRGFWHVAARKVVQADDGFGPREGLEGPFKGPNGRAYYYDPREGRYYDPGTDTYFERDYDPQLDTQRRASGGFEAGTDSGPPDGQTVYAYRVEPWEPLDDGEQRWGVSWRNVETGETGEFDFAQSSEPTIQDIKQQHTRLARSASSAPQCPDCGVHMVDAGSDSPYGPFFECKPCATVARDTGMTPKRYQVTDGQVKQAQYGPPLSSSPWLQNLSYEVEYTVDGATRVHNNGDRSPSHWVLSDLAANSDDKRVTVVTYGDRYPKNELRRETREMTEDGAWRMVGSAPHDRLRLHVVAMNTRTAQLGQVPVAMVVQEIEAMVDRGTDPVDVIVQIHERYPSQAASALMEAQRQGLLGTDDGSSRLPA
jgi:hypothetical protein